LSTEGLSRIDRPGKSSRCEIDYRCRRHRLLPGFPVLRVTKAVANAASRRISQKLGMSIQLPRGGRRGVHRGLPARVLARHSASGELRRAGICLRL
jgi:hypothetical protein